MMDSKNIESKEQKLKDILQAEFEKREELESKLRISLNRIDELEKTLSELQGQQRRKSFSLLGMLISCVVEYYRKNFGASSNRKLLQKEASYWTPVFNSVSYCRYNPKVREQIGTDEEKLLQHFICYGMDAGLRASDNFDLEAYYYCNSDVEKLYGMNKRGAYLQYIERGIYENRKASW